MEIEIACCNTPEISWLSARSLPVMHELEPTKSRHAHALRLLSRLCDNTCRFNAAIVNDIW